MKIPFLMATQHPDSATRKVSTSEEITEAIIDLTPIERGGYGCDEQLVDYEGKLTPYLQVKWIAKKMKEENVTGLITPRIPNPWLEGMEKHLLAMMAALMGNNGAHEKHPVKYIIYPMSSRPEELLGAQKRLQRLVVFLADELGTPRGGVSIIPLVETVDSLLRMEHLLREFVKAIDEGIPRIFLGKSDSALHDGHVISTLALKKALYEAWHFEKCGIILGVGSPPFRGGVVPELVDSFVKMYGGANTITVQSALRYDRGRGEYRKTIETLRKIKQIAPIEVKISPQIISRGRELYHKDLSKIVDALMRVAPVVPSRRDRLTTEQYGRTASGYRLPRAIRFACSLYTMGLPPSLLGAELLLEHPGIIECHDFRPEMEYALSFFSPAVLSHHVPKETVSHFKTVVHKLSTEFGLDVTRDLAHETLLIKGALNREDLSSYLVRAAAVRGFLG